MFSNRECPMRQIGVNQNFESGSEVNMDIDVNMAGACAQPYQMMNQPMMQPAMSQPIIEPMQERIVNRTIMHEVPHVCPMRTKVINNHVFRHTYRPNYSCCEENTCTSVQCGSCCQFR